MSEQINADRAEEPVSSESGLLLSVEPLQGGGRLSAKGDDDSDSGGITGGDADSSDSDSGLGDTDTLSGDSDGSDADASDADGTDGGDSTESESGLGGENPLGINRERVKNGDDKDTRDT